MEAATGPGCVVLLLHGLTMRPETMSAFASVFEPFAVVRCPAGPVEYADGSRSWWPVDLEKRAFHLARGPMDLFDRVPPQRDRARAALHAAVTEARAAFPRLPLVLAGFSQGGMLSVDYLLLHPEARVDALALVSASRIDLETWQPHLARLAGLRVWQAHGVRDEDLGFAAGERLRDLLVEAGAHATFQPYDGGHEMTLAVWRGLRHFVKEQARAGIDATATTRPGEEHDVV